MELVGGTAPPLKIDTERCRCCCWAGSSWVLGLVIGRAGVAFNKCLVMAMDWRAKPSAVCPSLCRHRRAAVGVLWFVLPAAVGGGEPVDPRHAPMANLPIQILVLIAVVRFIGTMASLSRRVPAGIFSPMLTFRTTSG